MLIQPGPGPGGLVFEWFSPRETEQQITRIVAKKLVKARYDREAIFEVKGDGTLDLILSDKTDLPSISFEICMGKDEKCIYAYDDYPKRLDWFYDLILDLTDAREWVGEWDGMSRKREYKAWL